MRLYKISEPQEECLVVGIDLGTTNSLVGYYDGEEIIIIPDKYSVAGIVPSVVAYSEEGIRVGHEALQEKNHIKSVKRLIGKGLDDSIAQNNPYDLDKEQSSDSILKLKTFEKSVTPIEVSAEILKYLKNNAEQHLGKKVTQAVITVPAHFDDSARIATKDAARIAGLEVLRIINEPTAAAIAYGLNTSPDEVVLVYDLGGGTFDISILKNKHGVMVVAGTGGDNNLGGDDFDRSLLQMMCKKARRDLDSIGSQLEGLRIASDCKKYLSDNKNWVGDFYGVQISVTRSEALSIWQALIDRTLQITREVIFEADLYPGDITHVILAGGATKMLAVQRAVEDLFRIRPMMSIDPDLVVVIGATKQAKALTYGNPLLVDVVPLSLGIELLGEVVEVIIPRNTPIPTRIKKLYTTYKDNQSGFKIHIVQGEGTTVGKCRSLGRFELNGLPKKPAGEVKLEVSFKVDADGILVVAATEVETGKTCEIEVKPSYGMTEDEIKRLIVEFEN